MDIKTDSVVKEDAPPSPSINTPQLQQPHLPGLLREVMIMAGLALVALLPRLLLAMQLDVVTDEIIYILGGKRYFPLLIHLNIGASGWHYNYEHPPFVKLLIGLAISLNTAFSHPLSELLAARLPSVLFGVVLIVAIYALARAPFGRVVALLAALCLAVSPWLVYFSALAYLDMTMTALVTIAYLLLWHAIRRPWLYVLAAALMGLAIDSKYTAALAIPGIVLFCGYYYFLLRPRMPLEQRPPLPWAWWIAAVITAPVVFFVADPAIWPNPISLLYHSFDFEWHHSYGGHLTFLAGQYSLHVPHWAILYIIFTKISIFVTIGAACFVIFALLRLVRFHRHGTSIDTTEAASTAFLLIWLLALLGTFSLLNIVVGTHYHLPIAPPVALAGASGLAILLRYRRGQLFIQAKQQTQNTISAPGLSTGHRTGFNVRAAVTIALLTIILVGPHLLGLSTIYAVEGYTSEIFHGENTALQVAYPAYREAARWLAAHTHGPATVGLGAILGSLDAGADGATWYSYNSDLPKRLTFSEAHPTDKQFSYDYLVWPMHLVQRGYALPEMWRSHIVHIVMGGNTIYCYIMARNPTNVS